MIAPQVPTITKNVTQTSVDAGTGDWTVTYDVTVTNPDPAVATTYSLSDELPFASGVTVNAVVTSSDTAPSVTWDGLTDTAVATDVVLPAAATHTYTVTATADLGTLDPESATATASSTRVKRAQDSATSPG